MLIKKPFFIKRLFIVLFTSGMAAGFSANLLAWGNDGHAAVGVLSLEQLPADTRLTLEQVLGSVSDQTIVEACNWPDAVRETAEWEWSYPLHFINIQPGNSSYSRSRDCPDGKCATEAIKNYARELGDKRASAEKRQQAFAWLCHLVGDLHQPLHAGYAHDRGGNDFEITFRGEQTNLHNFWDRALIGERAGDWHGLISQVRNFPTVKTSDNWTPAMVDHWTNESHQLVLDELYPDDLEITQSYADRSWALLQQRIATAASRLAWVIESVL